MSRGPGRIEQAIAAEIARCLESDGRYAFVSHVTAWRIFQRLHPRTRWGLGEPTLQPTRPQRYAVTRAMHRFVERHQQFALMGGKGRGELVLYDASDARSRRWAELATTPGAGFVPKARVF